MGRGGGVSDLTIARRRLEALEKVERILRDEWGNCDSGPISVFSDCMAVDVSKHMVESGVGGCWLNAAGIYKAVRELRGDMEEMARHAEEYAAGAA